MLESAPKGECDMEDATALTAKTSRTQTQWTAQFLVAAELTRRGYTVSFTMGNNTPIADLMVGTFNGTSFWVDVKGLSSKTAWLARRKATCSELYYILVYLSPIAKADRFFILTQTDAGALLDQYAVAHPNDKGKLTGFGFKGPDAFENAWDKLPKP
jgi:hypothetical protein